MLVLAVAIGLCAGIALDRFVLPHGARAAGAGRCHRRGAAGGEAGGVIASGTFIQPDANNPLQRGAGGVSVSDGKVVLGADFAVTPGPDYRVLLVPKPAIRAAADIDKTMYVDLGAAGRLSGQSGLCGAGRRRSLQIPERRHLVRPVRDADLCGRSQLRRVRPVGRLTSRRATATQRLSAGAPPMPEP